MVDGWPVDGRWLVDGWPMDGRWMADRWSMVGRWMVECLHGRSRYEVPVSAGSGFSPCGGGFGEGWHAAGSMVALALGVRDGMWDSMCEAMPWLVKCSAGMGTAGVCA